MVYPRAVVAVFRTPLARATCALFPPLFRCCVQVAAVSGDPVRCARKPLHRGALVA